VCVVYLVFLGVISPLVLNLSALDKRLGYDFALRCPAGHHRISPIVLTLPPPRAPVIFYAHLSYPISAAGWCFVFTFFPSHALLPLCCPSIKTSIAYPIYHLPRARAPSTPRAHILHLSMALIIVLVLSPTVACSTMHPLSLSYHAFISFHLRLGLGWFGGREGAPGFFL